MKIFLTGATGYIGGSVASGLIAAGHNVVGLARSEERAVELRGKSIEPLIGSLDDHEILARASQDAEAIVNAANADDRGAAEAMLSAIVGSDKLFLHTSGSSIVGQRDQGEKSDAIFDETTPIEPSAARVARVALNTDILAFSGKGVRAVVVCPSLIYGLGLGVNQHSMQVPWLIDLARKSGVARHIGSGENIWSNVHIDDLVELYILAFDKAPAGGFYFAENGEESMRDVCRSINKMLGVEGAPKEMSLDDASAEWGEGPANNTMASNSRVRANRARQELGWAPKAPSLINELERGCYAN